MLKTFKVKNFKNFKDEFVFDLSSTKNYEFNPECVQDGMVKNGIVYGPNGCGKTNLGYAIFDIQTHLTNDKTDVFYGTNYLNAESRDKKAKFSYTFQFGNDTVEYEYTKESVDKLVDEAVKINGREVISLHRQKSTQAFIDLKGTESLNRNFAASDAIEITETLSVVKFVIGSSLLESNQENQVFKKFASFIKYMRFLTTEITNAVKASPKEIANVILAKENGLKDFEAFLQRVGVPCRLETMDISGEKHIAFDFGDKKIDFSTNASTGTLSLTFQYIILVHFGILRSLICQGVSEASEEKELNSRKPLLPDFTPFIFIDEFDAFYHYAVAREMVEVLKKIGCQFVLTTHNTGIMSNDLLRPDCYFIMSNTDIAPAYSFTDKELRKAHNIEKMYRAGVFNDG
ncbi:MAG: AAA family ATPase [Lentisphaeria bacterium]|nr:AAA family ATPase [Lentisphaeria bacterium]